MFEQAFKNIDDILWKDAGASGELDYTKQTSWLLFLKYLGLGKRQGHGSRTGRTRVQLHSGRTSPLGTVGRAPMIRP